ncbi:hypothetical protein ACOSQ4_025552 [Xanthoceras sorbifolium]
MTSFLLLSQLQEMLIHPLISLICVPLCILVAYYLFFTISTSKKLPPSPSQLPIIGNLHQLGTHPHRSLRSLAQRYGPIMLLHLGRKPAVVVLSPDLAREILKTHDTVFANRPDSRIAKRLFYWRQMRSICVMQLLSAKRVKSFRMYREEETAELIKKRAQSCTCSSPIDLSELLVSLTRNLICRAAFGRKYGEGEGEGESGRTFKKLLEELGEMLGAFSVGDFIPWLGWLDQVSGLDAKVERVFNEFDHFFSAVIDDHMARQDDEDHMDLLDILLQIQKDGSNGVCMVKEHIKAILLDMFAGATDTTYTVIEWAMTEILRHPEIMKKVQEEIRGIAGSKLQINEDDLGKMLYLKALIKETMRLHYVEVGGYNILAETRVMVNAWAIGRDPATWPEAEQFKPERFMHTSLDLKGHDFELIPFGAGRRGCPGATFALAVVELVLASLLHNFNWTLPGGARGEDLDDSESTGMSVHKKCPLVLLASPHSF